ncbi:MAG: glycosyl transferase [Sneathiella sp.]|jgi:putative glycosyltransferase|uniref:glycosyltransferase family 2 protein n=1 Tax=Sneathiella sp. TaxID=1964365 RepID=UPI000C6AD31D|nr:glycosyltransferase family 2 protein [Sneathiella sp.]MAL78743.1 glycosyl transferase [Sneathiella sp.]|tara:strand:- start:11909 stop:12841 length:933 start_codon:yes stop_codon:yes gene_type:complete
MKLSIVSTLYKSAAHIAEFHERISKAAKELVGQDYEIVLVNDGSPDDSLELAIEIADRDDHVCIVDLSRNFGHHKAMMAGLAHSKGDYVFLIDSDLEEDPDWLRAFSIQMAEENCDVVYGIQSQRKGGWFERWSGNLYYRVFKLLIDIDHPTNITTVRLMTRRYVDALLTYKERAIVISGLWVLTGFDQKPRLVTKKSSSPTTYSLVHKLSHAVNVITSFSSRPLIFIFFTGLIIFLLSMAYVVFIVLNRLLFMTPLDGWTSVMASIWLLGGIIISFIGIIGIYLSKIFIETKERPNVIVRGLYGKHGRD